MVDKLIFFGLHLFAHIVSVNPAFETDQCSFIHWAANTVDQNDGLFYMNKMDEFCISLPVFSYLQWRAVYIWRI